MGGEPVVESSDEENYYRPGRSQHESATQFRKALDFANAEDSMVKIRDDQLERVRESLERKLKSSPRLASSFERRVFSRDHEDSRPYEQ